MKVPSLMVQKVQDKFQNDIKEIITFKKTEDKSMYKESNYFSYNNNKLELKKYNNYKLSEKM